VFDHYINTTHHFDRPHSPTTAATSVKKSCMMQHVLTGELSQCIGNLMLLSEKMHVAFEWMIPHMLFQGSRQEKASVANQII
ncbi:hypothetical protein, partial [Vibrio metschnikovii]|uniref:hypothetical protein n=1 Tax=Vibrio metschnikovii TaxID=28172 RepID=UPI002FCA51EA